MRGGNRSGQAEAKLQASGRRGSRRMKYHCKAVHAVAQAGRLRAIVEDVAEMAAAAAAVNFGPQHAKSAVFGFADGILERLVTARPAGAALELRLRREQPQVGSGAGENALAFLFQQGAPAGTRGPSRVRIFL